MRRIFHTVVILTFGALLASAQTSEDFRAKFGKPLESYEVGSNILLTVAYDPAGKVSVLTLQRKHADRMSHPGENKGDAFDGMNETEVNALLSEVIPDAMRGKRISSISFNTGCGGSYIEAFTNLQIARFGSCAPDSGLYMVQVRWNRD